MSSSLGAWTPPYDRTYSENPSLASCEHILEKERFDPHMCPYTHLAEYYTLFKFEHLPLSVVTLMHRHGLTLSVSKTIADGHRSPFWITGEVPTMDCGKMVKVDKHSRVHGKGYITQVLCAALATLHLHGDASTTEFATDNATPNFKPYSVWFGADGFVQLYLRFHGRLLQMTLDENRGSSAASCGCSPHIYLFDGSSVATSFDEGQPQFPALKGRAWFPSYQLRNHA